MRSEEDREETIVTRRISLASLFKTGYKPDVLANWIDDMIACFVFDFQLPWCLEVAFHLPCGCIDHRRKAGKAGEKLGAVRSGQHVTGPNILRPP